MSPLYTWQDGRGDLLLSEEQSYAEHLSALTGYSLATGLGMVTHYYNLRNKLVPPQASSLCTIADYLVMKLTGRPSPLLNPTNAASLGCFDIQSGAFDGKVLVRADLEMALLPQVSNELTAAAPLRKDLFGKTLPVFPAIGDNQASFLGSVKDVTRSLLVNIGTGSQISRFSTDFLEIPGLETRPFPQQGCLLVGAPLCGGKSYALLESFFRQVMGHFTGEEPISLYELMSQIEPESLNSVDLLQVDTRFQGTREKQAIRGSIGNISLDNFTPGNMITGFLEGIALELFQFYRLFPERLRSESDMLIGSGNGIRFNRLQRDILERVFNRKLIIPKHEEEAACGAALAAAVGFGALPDVMTAGVIVHGRSRHSL